MATTNKKTEGHKNYQKKDHENIDLLRYKSFVVSKNFTDEEVQSSGFSDQVLKYFKATRPFFDYMSEVLTTDSNGVSLIG